MVKICNIETFQVGMPLTKTFTSGNKSKNTTRCLVVRVTADDGTVGISSVDPSTRAVFPAVSYTHLTLPTICSV